MCLFDDLEPERGWTSDQGSVPEDFERYVEDGLKLLEDWMRNPY